MSPLEDVGNPNYQQLLGHCFVLSEINNGDLIEIGENSKGKFYCRVDRELVAEFLDEVIEMKTKCDIDKLKEWLTTIKIDNFSAELFAAVLSFTRKLTEKYPPSDDKGDIRYELYNQSAEQNLSTLFEKNAAECAEISIMGQLYLQKICVSSQYFSGELIKSPTQEFPEEHSFLVIQNGNPTYIWDPTNPINSDQGTFPAIYKINYDFITEVSKGKQIFIRAENIITRKSVYFGVNNSGGIDVQQDILN